MNTTNHAANKSLGLLMVYPHNASGARVQTVLGPPQLNTVVSRKTHGGAGTFDIVMPLTGLGVENRSSSGLHQIRLGLNVPVTSGAVTVTSGIATIDSVTFDNGEVVVQLSGTGNAQAVGLQLANINGGTDAVSTSIGFLVGDVTGNADVNASDIGAVKAASGSAVSASNFRADVNLNGAINSSDIGMTKAASGNSIL